MTVLRHCSNRCGRREIPLSNSSPVNVAWGQLEHWLSARNVWVLAPGNRHQEILGRLLIRLGGGAKLIPDAHLAALAIEHGLELCSTDGDFARFDGLRWVNPLLS